MSVFQIAVVVVGAGLLGVTVLATVRGKASKREGLAWSLVWASMVVAVLEPQVLTRLAAMVGIGRGADLLLYCTAVATLIGFVMVYARLRRLRRDVTLLVRELALRDAVGPKD